MAAATPSPRPQRLSAGPANQGQVGGGLKAPPHQDELWLWAGAVERAWIAKAVRTG